MRINVSPGTRSNTAVFLTAAFLSLASAALAEKAFFATGGQLIGFDGTTATRTRAVEKSRDAVPPEISGVWGALKNGRVLVRLDASTSLTQEERGARRLAGGQMAIVKADGAVETIVHNDALRAVPGPTDDSVAIINTARELSIWRDGTVRPVPCEGKVSGVAWSPDSTRLVLTVYPADWSPDAVNNARTTEEFLRLQNSKLLLLDVSTLQVMATLVSDPGTNYNPFFSPEGHELYYIWLDAREDAGGLMCLTLDKDGGTSSSERARQLTRAGEEEGEVPLGRVGTYKWANSGRDLVFEAGVPDESGVIWTMSRSGTDAKSLAPGRAPQMLDTSTLAILAPNGEPIVLKLEAQQ